MLNALDWNNALHIPRDLIVLIRHQIGSTELDWERKEKQREFRIEALDAMMTLLSQGKEPSYRAIGKLLGVNATTVMRNISNSNGLEAFKEMRRVRAQAQKKDKQHRT